MSQPLSIYIHWPFCASLCPYCDFNSHVAKTIDHDAWANAYISELRHWHEQTPDHQVVSIFWGGGTPSLMPPQTVQKVLDEIHRLWPVDTNCEVTLEANPGSTDVEKLAAFKMAGINRVSIGVQSLNDKTLEFLGRKHRSAEALTVLNMARGLFDRVSADFIYAMVSHMPQIWEQELKQILDLELGHLSLYQLTLEEGTPFYHRAQRGEAMTANEPDSAEMFELTQTLCTAASLPAYEVSNHACTGHEARHNLAYWQYDDYLGIGPGAHGRVTLGDVKHATTTHRAPGMYLKRVKEKGHGLNPLKPVPRPDALKEMLLMGLRLSVGVPKSRIEFWSGKKFDELFRFAILAPYKNEGLIWETSDAMGATPTGMMRLNALIKSLCQHMQA